jgi:YVTN family beta-propeller protein
VTAAAPQLRIFISYRRDDSQGFARSIHDRLAQHFGGEAVFRDINDIEPGRPWEEAIDQALVSCDVFVLLIGRGWLDATDDEGKRRIDDPEDRHRREIETAIDRRIRMFVVLMEDAHMPRRKQLPQTSPGQEYGGVALVPALHALRIADHAFDYGIEELIANIERASEQAHESEVARQREAAEDLQREAEAERDREAEGQLAADEQERKRAEEEARRRAEAEERARAEEERKRAAERATEGEITKDDEAERRRRLLTFAAVGLGALVVVVVALVIASSGGDGGGAAVDGAPIPVGDLPVALVYDNGGLWVANRRDGSVSRIEDGESPKASDETSVGGDPEGIAVAAGTVLVSDGAGDSLSVIDQNGDLGQPITVNLRPASIAVAGDTAWVANEGSRSVSRLAPPDENQSIPVGDGPYGVASGAGAVWVTNRGEGTVSRINTTTHKVDDTIPVGANPKGIAVGDDAVWVANTDDNTVSRIDLTSLTADDEISVEDEPRGVVSAFGSVWVTNGGSDSVSRIDPEEGEVVQTIAVGAEPEGITAGPDSVWVANGGDNTVTRITP